MYATTTHRPTGSLHVPVSVFQPPTSATNTDRTHHRTNKRNSWLLVLLVLMALIFAGADVPRVSVTPLGLARVVAADLQGPFLNPLIKSGLRLCSRAPAVQRH
jgi:hypothetical protein